MKEAKVTICIPVFNAENYIVATLDSVYNQIFKEIEVIILDDSSNDKSVSVIQNWLLDKSENYKFIRNEKNIGLLKSCNLLLSLVKTTYFQILGHDDIIYPNKILEEYKLLNHSKDNIAMVYSNMNIIDSLGNEIGNSFFDRSEYLGSPPSGDIYNEIIKGNFINASSVLCKTKSVKDEGGYNENLFFEDWPMWIKLSSKYRIEYIDLCFGAYRVSNTSMIHKNKNKVKIANTTFLMYLDLLELDYPNKAFLKQMINKFAIYNFKLCSKNAKNFLRIALTNKFNLKIFLYYIMSICKIKFPNSLQKNNIA